MPSTPYMNTHLNVIVGLGKTGLSCAKYCLREKLSFAITDSRENPPCLEELKEIAPDIDVVLGKISNHLISKADRLILSPGVSLNEPIISSAIKNGKAFVGDIELFVQKVTAPIVAITGTNGKSTVTTLVGKMAEQAGKKVRIAGNIGLPVLDLLDQPQAYLYVLELSSFQLETTSSLKAKAATVLNITEDHIDRHGTMEGYTKAKMKIYNSCQNAIINRTMINKNMLQLCQHANIYTFGLDAPSNEKEFGLLTKNNIIYLAFGNKLLISTDDVKLTGMHQYENALAALALGNAAGIELDAMVETLKNFEGLQHRCQLVKEKGGIKWFNDSKGTNVGSTIAAIEGLGPICPGKIILIAGGLGKNADFSPLTIPVKKHVKSTILIGQDAQEIESKLNGCCEIKHAGFSFEEAIRIAKQSAKSGDFVLLSPACASFDMFKNYEHRGEEFIRLANLLV